MWSYTYFVEHDILRAETGLDYLGVRCYGPGPGWFTGKERDAETGLDYFGARYLSSAQGRWTSPDMVNLTEERVVSPSNTLNKYVYGGNDLMLLVDLDGRDTALYYIHGFPTGHLMLAADNPRENDFAFVSVGPQVHLDPNTVLNPVEGVQGRRPTISPRLLMTCGSTAL